MYGLRVDEVWGLTPTEFGAVGEAWLARRRDDMLRRAWEVSHTIQVVTGQSLSPAQLVGDEAPRDEVETGTGDSSLVAKLRRAHARANFHDI